MSASELLGRGDSGADADWDWEIAREMNQSWPARCCLRDSTREDDDARVPVAWIELKGGAGAVIDGDDDDDEEEEEEGSGVAAGVRWRVIALLLLLLRDGDCCCGCVGLGPRRLRELYHDATSPWGESYGVDVDLAEVGVGVETFPHSSYERRAGTNFGALARRREAWKPADEDSICQGSRASSSSSSSSAAAASWPVSRNRRSLSASASYSERM